ncbi:MAG: VWA domain-containing protein [Bryobacteraceae bacterium]|nr:VWA domain-containing protein [Bryobacteraceae bacterium]
MKLSVATQPAKRGKRRAAQAWLLLLAMAAGAAPGPAQNSQQRPTDQSPLVRINVDLVQMDVVVSDAKGNHVTDLKPEEFEILENGKPQRITNFSFLSDERAGAVATAPDAKDKKAPPVPPARITAGEASRTIAVVIDDLGVGEQSFMAIHAALEKFIDQQVGPRDLVAIITTSGRLGALQSLTSDKRLLRAALNKFRSIPNHRVGVLDDDFTCVYGGLGAAGPAAPSDEDAYLIWKIAQGSPPRYKGEDPLLELENDHRSVYYGLLSLSTFRRVVDGLRELPGRRSILLFTEGLPLVRAHGRGEVNTQITDGYEALLNHANRSGIAVNTIDPRGLIATFETAESESPECSEAQMSELNLTQLQLSDMAKRTGGISMYNDNDIAGAMARVMNDQLGYYLIAYKPPETVKGQQEFRKIAVRATRPGVKVRYHNSLYTQEPEQAQAAHAGNRLVAAVESPFAVSDVRLRCASRFWDAGTGAGSVLDTLLEIDARDLTFHTDSDGRRTATFEILAETYGSTAKPLDTFEKSYTMSFTERAYQRALREGLVQKLELRVKQAGAYQIRGAVRDHESGRVGSASEFVEVPDLSKGKLALSGIALGGANGDPHSTEATHRLRFRAGETVLYAYQVLNAKPAADGSTNVELRATLYHDGKALGTSAPMAIDPKDQTDAKRLVVNNDFRLGKQLAPGDYMLQVTAVDKNAPEKRSTASQTADFEVVEPEVSAGARTSGPPENQALPPKLN